MRLGFDFYGVRLSAESECEPLLERIERDFGYFRSETAARAPDAVRLRFVEAAPPLERIPRGARPLFSTASYTTYRLEGRRLVDHRGLALTEYDFRRDEGTVWAESAERLHEVAYLLVLSRVGILLDRRGFHRLHALAVTYRGRALLFLAPSGCGKTIFGLELLKRREVGWLSDEIPLLAPDGRVAPFPLPPRFTRGESPPWPPPPVRTFDVSRSKRPPKSILDPAAILPRVASPAPPFAVFLCRRQDDRREPSIRRVGVAAGLAGIFANALVGREFPQMKAYFLEVSPRFLPIAAAVATSRARSLVRLALRAPAHRFGLTRDPAANARVLEAFLEGVHAGLPEAEASAVEAPRAVPHAEEVRES